MQLNAGGLPLVVLDLRGETAQQSSCDDHTTFLFRCSESCHSLQPTNACACSEKSRSTAKLFTVKVTVRIHRQGGVLMASNRLTIACCAGWTQEFLRELFSQTPAFGGTRVLSVRPIEMVKSFRNLMQVSYG